MIMKRLSSVLILSILSLLAFEACKKNVPLEFIIEGQVYDKSYNQNHDGGVVKLYKVLAATTQEILVDTQVISNGTFKFVFERDRSEKYVIRFSKDGYFDEMHTIFFSQLEVNEAFPFSFDVEAAATMHWVFVDQAPINPGYSVAIQKLNGRTNGGGACPNQQYEYAGGLPPDTLRCSVGGNQYIKFYVIKLPNITMDSVYCPAYEDSYYTVNF
jgi:hypothetical protein